MDIRTGKSKARIFTIRVNLQSFVKYFYQVQDQLQAFQESEADEILEMIAIYTLEDIKTNNIQLDVYPCVRICICIYEHKCTMLYMGMYMHKLRQGPV